MSMMRELLMARQQKKEIVKWLDANRTDSAEMAASDAAAIAVFKQEGLCAHDDFMTIEEANNVVSLPNFNNKTKLKNWDWSALISLNGGGSDNFSNCSNLEFTTIGDKFGTLSNNLFRTFLGCGKLVLTSLPDGFGRDCNRVFQTFAQCTNLALSSLPDGFGNTATTLQGVFNLCPNITLSSLPDGFGSMATDMESVFNGCSKITLSSLPDGFGSMATTFNSTFKNCSKITISSLPDGFGQNTTNLFNTFWGCSSIIGEFTIPDNFAPLCKEYPLAFGNTKITAFVGGAFNLSNCNKTQVTGTGLYRFIPTTCTSIRFVKNTLKNSLANSVAYLTNIDNESLFSLAECLFDFGSQQNNKIWTVTSAQKTILDTEMYDDTRTYTQYCEDKGWTVTTE